MTILDLVLNQQAARCAILAAFVQDKGMSTMAEKKNDPIQQAATEELRNAPSDEGNTNRIAAELTRIRHEMTAIRKILQGRESIEDAELKALQGPGNIEGGTF